MKVLHGKPVAQVIEQNVVNDLKQIKTSVGLAFIRVGDNPASIAYIHMKKQKCKEVGITSFDFELPEKATQKDVHKLIEELNQNTQVHGILLQLPLPSHLEALSAIEKIDPKKDVDGFHPMNMGRLVLGDPKGIIPCTPKGIVALLQYYDIPIASKNVVVVGRSYVVGRPLSLLLSQKDPHLNATVTLAHSASRNLKELCQKADIAIIAVGKAHAFDRTFFAKGSTVIDVGISRSKEGLQGDVNPEGCESHLGALSPVPGGVGPMTIAMLMQNTIECVRNAYCDK